MRAIYQLNKPEKEEAMSLYEYLLTQGEEKGDVIRQFKVFRKGLKQGMNPEALADLVDIPKELAQQWKALLDKDPSAEFPG